MRISFIAKWFSYCHFKEIESILHIFLDVICLFDYCSWSEHLWSARWDIDLSCWLHVVDLFLIFSFVPTIQSDFVFELLIEIQCSRVDLLDSEILKTPIQHSQAKLKRILYFPISLSIFIDNYPASSILYFVH